MSIKKQPAMMSSLEEAVNALLEDLSGSEIVEKQSEHSDEFISLQELQGCQTLIEKLFVPESAFNKIEWKDSFCTHIEKYKRIIYSSITSTIYAQIKENKNAEIYDVIDMRMKEIHNLLETDKEKKFFLKFYDRTNHCLQHSNFISTHYGSDLKKLNSEVIKTVNEANTTSEKMSELCNQIEILQNNAKSAQREYVAVLGIFTAVILSFTSGSMFLNSALSNVHQTPFWRVAFTSTLVGTLLLNMLIALFMFIKKIVRNDDEMPKYVGQLNFVCLLLIIITIVGGMINFGNLDKEIIPPQKVEQVAPASNHAHVHKYPQ